MIRFAHAFPVLLVVTLAACGGAEPGAETTSVGAADSAGGMAGMEGMAGMASADTAQMQAHIREMEAASGDSLLSMRDQHRQMVANMLAQMNSEMRDMGMTADPAWTATIDSLRTDLTRMPEMSASEMKAMMPDHHRRVERLMVSHEEMMRQMGH